MSTITAFFLLAAVGLMFSQVVPAKNTRSERFTEAEFEAVWAAEEAKRASRG